MIRLRFPLIATALFAGAQLAHAQTGPAPAAAPPPPPVKVDDIQVSQNDGRISILVKFTGQPTAASAKSDGDALVLDIDGVALAPFTLDPPSGNLIAHVAAEPSGDGGSLVTLTGAALGTPSAVVYRNAVLITADLAEPKLAAPSLLAAAKPTTKPSMKSEPPKQEAKPAAKPAEAAAKPAEPKPAEPKPAEPQPKGLAAAASVGIDAAHCATAKATLDKDAWAIAAMGDHALCLLDAGKYIEAKNRLDQLAAFAPDDWRAAYGGAVMLLHDGKPDDAKSAFAHAATLAQDEKTRNAISHAATTLAGS